MNNRYEDIVDTNTSIVRNIRLVTARALRGVIDNTDGTIDAKATTAAELERSNKLVDTAVTHELKRRYGAV